MKIGITSDTHCEFGQPFPKIPEGIDLLILAGDCGDPYKTYDELQKLGVPYFYIAGNHEFYGHEHSKVIEDIFNNSNGCYENGTMEFMGKRIHGCTLWTDMKCYGVSDFDGYTRFMADERAIKGWTGKQAQKEFERSLEFLTDSVQEGDIVVTHHLPSYKSVNKKYFDSPYNHFFYTNLDTLIYLKKPSLFIHGHTHDACDYDMGKTRVVCNPHGYPSENPEGYEIKVLDI